MSLKGKLTTITIALALTGSAFAKESVCPDLHDLKRVGIQKASQLAYNYFIGYSIDNYNSATSWGFAIGPVEAKSEEETIEITNEILEDMTAPGVPEAGRGDDLVCMYETGDPNIIAVAIKGYEDISPVKLKQYLHR
ncbi:hemin binding protein (Hbp) homolog [Legionella wadsworthii]|uniref:Hemin binding protein (Hbp) homolog n=1 Tax=Legionella wadsworthii TaxID=28088 RepID=A0A378LSA5_9GAMM|nr:DUF4949 domain-containing protein [Legionella wadsworthii]STY28719.1 hemin binding protein (Hbp) homolog [Legionella wadsworthii]